jgi:hypothetical protein
VIGAAASRVDASLGAQTSQEQSADFTKAELAEVRNAQNQVILSGKFVVSDEDDDDIERKAALAPTGVDADAAGEAEVEVSKSGDKRRQEVEFSVTNVDPKGVFTFVIDGKVVATATADDRGRAEYEREIPLPAASTSR